MPDLSSRYRSSFDHLDSLKKSRTHLSINTPLELPLLIVANYPRNRYGALRLAKMSVLVNAITKIDCYPKPLPTVYLYGPDLLGEKEASSKYGIFVPFPQWNKSNGAEDDENYGLNKAKLGYVVQNYETHDWLQRMLSQLDQLSTDELIRLAYDFVFNRHTPSGLKRTIGLEAFSKTATNTILRNFMRANTNHLFRNGIKCTPKDTVKIIGCENKLDEGGFSNEDCLKIGPSNNILTYHAIYILNMFGWRACISSLSYLLACRYLRLETNVRSDKPLLKRLTGVNAISLEEQLQIEIKERSRLQKLAHRFVEKSVRSLLEEEAIEERKGAYFALGKDLQTGFGRISLEPLELHDLYSSILQNIREIDQLTIQRSAAMEPGTQSIRQYQPRPTIYIGSTCYDFRDLRQEIKQALRDWGYRPILNEDSAFPVEAGVDSYTACTEAVRQSDCLVLIIGTRYGGEVPEKGISITELEYETARNAGIPRINFCLDSVWNLIQFRKINPNVKYPEYFCEDKKKIDKIFDFLDRVRKYEEHKPDNWVHVFRNSVELKEILWKRLRKMFPQYVRNNRLA